MGVSIEKVREFVKGKPAAYPNPNQELAKAEIVAVNNSGSYIPSSYLAKIFGVKVALEIEFDIKPKSGKP